MRKKKKSVKKRNVDEAHVQLHMGIFVQKWCPISPFSFFSILERKLFGKSREKKLGSYYLFSFLSTLPNTLKKVFLLIFSLKYFIHPISPLNKHTLSF